MLTSAARRRGFRVALAFLAMVLILVLGEGTPFDSLYTCPFRLLTGHSCFGCGMTRATREVLHGNLLQSIYFHPMGIPFVFGFFVYAVHGLVQSALNREVTWGPIGWVQRYQSAIWMGVLVFVVLFGVVRFGLELTGFLTPV